MPTSRPSTDRAARRPKVSASILTGVNAGRQPVELDVGSLLTTELNLVWAMGCLTEIFEVTDDIVENWEKYALIISDTLPFDKALEALQLARTPGAADKVVVTFE